jgi:hypothetical protein
VKDEPLNCEDEEFLSIEEVEKLHKAAADKWLREVEEAIAKDRLELAAEGRSHPGLITRDELLAAGALEVPPGWRKSLTVKRVERDLFSMLEEEESSAEEEAEESDDPDDDDSTDAME